MIRVTMAVAESKDGYLRGAVRIIILPLIGSLMVSAQIFRFLSPINPDAAILLTGLVASAVLGLIYLSPIMWLGMRATKRRVTAKSLVYLAIGGIILTLTGTLPHGTTGILANLTSLTVMETILITPSVLVRLCDNLRTRLNQ